jgi:NAD(P)-dependent dehydrogenase (short-subunit alcohol dehydrogenase family)
MDLELTGKVALVTGGSKGIGKAVAKALAAEGADVALVARDLSVVQASAADIAQASGRKVRGYSADSGIDASVKSSVEDILKDFGRIDILVNCAAKPAGQGTPVPKLAQMSDELFYADVNIKVMGYVRFAREVAPIMQKNGYGRIINISGLAARQTGSIIGSIRNISVAALTKNLADELGPYGINVVCVHPGLTRTEKTPAVVKAQAAAANVEESVIEQRMADANTIHHLVTAEEVAHVVTFLASCKSVSITGDAIAVGGGRPGSIYY